LFSHRISIGAIQPFKGNCGVLVYWR